MRIERTWLVFALMAACGGNSQPTPTSVPVAVTQSVPDAGMAQTPEASIPIPDAMVAACIADETAEAECLAEGEHFRYGKRPGTESCDKAFGTDSLVGKPTEVQPARTFPCVCMMNDACVYSRDAAAQCAAKGANFFYGPSVFIRCQGTAPRPGEMECQHEQTRSSSCSCNDRVALARRMQDCSRIP